MLGWVLLGLAAVTAGIIVISGMVTKNRIKEKMRERGIKDAILTGIDNCDNTVKLENLLGGETLEIRGDELDDDLKKYDIITA